MVRGVPRASNATRRRGRKSGRMRHLRDKDRGKSADVYPGLAGYVVSRFARSQGWLDKAAGKQTKREIDDLGQGKKNKNYLRAPVMIRSRRSPKSSTAQNNRFDSGLKAAP